MYIAMLLSIFFAGIYLSLVCFGYWLRHETKFDEPADVAIVLGSLPYKALVRIQKAAQLYHQGLVGKLILTGKPKHGEYTEAQWLRQKALLLDILDSDLILEEAATNTRENMEFSYPIIKHHGFTSVILIQQEFSQVRGYLTARQVFVDLDIRLINQPASAHPYWHVHTWMFHRIGWRYTWMTVSRLIRYRLITRDYLFSAFGSMIPFYSYNRKHPK
jgi:uncharacterized SAM-binding protein YcdF (DUF218 family)